MKPIAVLRSFAKTLRRHEEGLLAYYDYPLSTRPVAGRGAGLTAQEAADQLAYLASGK